MGKGHIDGSRNCAGATNLRAEARVPTHLEVIEVALRQCSLAPRVLSVPVS